MGVKSCAGVALLALILVACSADEATTSTTLASVTTHSESATSSPDAIAPALSECRPGPPKIGFDLAYDDFFEFYQSGMADRLTGMIGDGPVHDPWLDPNHDGHFEDVASWVERANELGDRFIDAGYGMGEPFQIFAVRRSDALESLGIERLSLTLDLWVNQDCELRVETRTPVAGPDPCLLDVVFPQSQAHACEGPFPPTAAHEAVWTGSEVLLVGGHTGDFRPNGRTVGVVYNPSTSQARLTSPLPMEEHWSVAEVVWAEDRAFVIGRPFYDPLVEDYRPTILAYYPDRDDWQTVTRFPEGLEVVGAVVWTGSDLIFAGGEVNNASEQVWNYIPASDIWTEIDAPMPAVEGPQGVWTGTEIIFVGGYVHGSSGDGGVGLGYDPAREVWRKLASPGVTLIEYHDLLWTGEQVLVAPLQTLTSDRGVDASSWLLVYDPASDVWTRTSEMPIIPSIRGAVAWTGTELLIWGGLGAGYASADGAAYDPATDIWRLLAEPPLSPRCDHSGTWTGQAWVIIGGERGCGSPGGTSHSDGAIYNPATDSWAHLGS